jgi:two-component system cell cycle response regulator DivK
VGQKILVVEDNELNLRLFCDLLRVHGYEAEPVRDGREAVDRARAFAPDLIVMDIQMPHISGLELIDQLKADAELMTIPVMAVTAYAAKGDEERIRDAGAEGYVSKPISVIRFIEAVRALLTAAEARAVEREAAAVAAAQDEQSEAPAQEASEAMPEEDTEERAEADGSAEAPIAALPDADAEKPEAPVAPPAEESESQPSEAPDLFSRPRQAGAETREDPDPEIQSI